MPRRSILRQTEFGTINPFKRGVQPSTTVQAQQLSNQTSSIKNQLLQQLLGGEGIFGSLFGGQGGGLSQPGGPDGGGSGSLFDQLRSSRATEIRQDADEARGNIAGNLASRGLLSSTLEQSGQRGIDRERDRALNNLEGSILEGQIGAQQQQQNRQFGLIQQLLGGLL